MAQKYERSDTMNDNDTKKDSDIKKDNDVKKSYAIKKNNDRSLMIIRSILFLDSLQSHLQFRL